MRDVRIVYSILRIEVPIELRDINRSANYFRFRFVHRASCIAYRVASLAKNFSYLAMSTIEEIPG